MTKLYKDMHPFTDRIKESTRIREKYPNRIPIIVQVSSKCKLVLDKNKYLVPNDLTIGQFIYVLRKRLVLSPIESMFLSVKNTIPVSSSALGDIYEEFKDMDGFLYIEVSQENVFG